jgi:hypothetical protein
LKGSHENKDNNKVQLDKVGGFDLTPAMLFLFVWVVVFAHNSDVKVVVFAHMADINLYTNSYLFTKKVVVLAHMADKKSTS